MGKPLESLVIDVLGRIVNGVPAAVVAIAQRNSGDHMWQSRPDWQITGEYKGVFDLYSQSASQGNSLQAALRLTLRR